MVTRATDDIMGSSGIFAGEKETYKNKRFRKKSMSNQKHDIKI